MYMRMKQQVLSPGMQNGDQADLGAEAFRVRRHLQGRRGTRAEQQVIESARVFKREHIQFMRDAEDHVKVVTRQHFLFASCEPALTRLRLALRAMPVTARNGELSITCLMGSFF